MILEKSLQAQFLIPMAVSLGFGILFATFIILLGVPIGMRLLVGVQEFLGAVGRGETRRGRAGYRVLKGCGAIEVGWASAVHGGLCALLTSFPSSTKPAIGA